MTITVNSIGTMPKTLARIAPEPGVVLVEEAGVVLVEGAGVVLVEGAGINRTPDTARAPFSPGEWVIMALATVLIAVRRADITYRLSFKFKSSELDGTIRLDTLHGEEIIIATICNSIINIRARNPSIDKRATE